MQTLPRPTDELAGCCWLPRFAAKVRLAQARHLPFTYRLALASSLGIDGHFLRHFHLRKTAFFNAVLRSPDDAALAEWFLRQQGVTKEAVTQWNRAASRLGAKGQPGYAIFQLIKWILYPKAVRHPVGSLFEAIEQDEQT